MKRTCILSLAFLLGACGGGGGGGEGGEGGEPVRILAGEWDTSLTLVSTDCSSTELPDGDYLITIEQDGRDLTFTWLFGVFTGRLTGSQVTANGVKPDADGGVTNFTVNGVVVDEQFTGTATWTSGPAPSGLPVDCSGVTAFSSRSRPTLTSFEPTTIAAGGDQPFAVAGTRFGDVGDVVAVEVYQGSPPFPGYATTATVVGQGLAEGTLPMEWPVVEAPVWAEVSLTRVDGGTVSASGLTLLPETPPGLVEPAVFHDDVADGAVGAGDSLSLRFDRDIVFAPGSAAANAFALLVQGDSLGSAATLEAGGSAREIVVRLGTGAALRVSGPFLRGPPAPVAGAPSGIDLLPLLPPGTITATTGLDAKARGGQDIVLALPEVPTSLASSGLYSLLNVDVDGDGDMDLIDPPTVWLNGGGGGFTPGPTHLGGVPAYGVAAGNVVGNPLPDLLLDGTMWRNDGGGAFTNLGAVFASQACAIGDMNGDTYGDLIEGTTSGVVVWLGDGLGGFTASAAQLTGGTIVKVAVGDLDGDADLDVVAQQGGWASPRIGLNDATGTLSEPGTVPMPYHVFEVALGDVDGDSDLDIVDGGDSGMHVRRNAGGGGFPDVGNSVLPGYIQPAVQVALADVDGDGRLDILAVGGSLSPLSGIWFNEGGMFSTRMDGAWSPGVPLSGVAAADLDGDGDVDVIARDTLGNLHRWFNPGVP
jgi:hypothetical protein